MLLLFVMEYIKRFTQMNSRRMLPIKCIYSNYSKSSSMEANVRFSPEFRGQISVK